MFTHSSKDRINKKINKYILLQASPRLKLDELLVDIVLSRIKHGDAMDTIFNDVQAKVS